MEKKTRKGARIGKLMKLISKRTKEIVGSVKMTRKEIDEKCRTKKGDGEEKLGIER